MLKTAIFIAAAALLTGCAGVPASDAQNFDICLRGERACDAQRLTPAQRTRIEQLNAAAHLEDCMNRRRCNESLLNETERGRVRAAVARLNLDACRTGAAECDESLLDEDQAIEVAELSRRRNLEHCLGGLTQCDADRLTEAEAQQVHDAYLKRNFSGCMNMVGTLVECEPWDLTEEQKAAVQRRNLAVNYYLCANNAFGCQLSQLTAEQRERLAREMSQR